MSSTLSGSSPRKCIRLREARLQAVSSRNMYSEQGLEPLMRPSLGQVCHSLMVVSNCTPGSALAHAALPMRSHRSRRSEEHTSELQSCQYLVCRLLLEKKK